MKTYPSHTSLMMAERGFFWELKKKGKTTFSSQSSTEFLKQQAIQRGLQLFYFAGLAQ